MDSFSKKERSRLRTTLDARVKKKKKIHTTTLGVPCIRTITNTPQTPRKTELNGAIPRTARSSSIGHHSARFCGAKERGDTIPVDRQQITYNYRTDRSSHVTVMISTSVSIISLPRDPRESWKIDRKRDETTPLETKATNFPPGEEKVSCPSARNDKNETTIRSIRPNGDVFGLLISHRHATDSRKPA